jgi:hypothetical protein
MGSINHTLASLTDGGRCETARAWDGPAGAAGDVRQLVQGEPERTKASHHRSNESMFELHSGRTEMSRHPGTLTAWTADMDLTGPAAPQNTSLNSHKRGKDGDQRTLAAPLGMGQLNYAPYTMGNWLIITRRCFGTYRWSTM